MKNKRETISAAAYNILKKDKMLVQDRITLKLYNKIDNKVWTNVWDGMKTYFRSPFSDMFKKNVMKNIKSYLFAPMDCRRRADNKITQSIWNEIDNRISSLVHVGWVEISQGLGRRGVTKFIK